MSKKSKIHFEISERKVLLRIVDIIVVMLVLYGLEAFTDFDYFVISKERLDWVIVLILYLSIFGSVFELYELQKASKIDIVLKNILIASSLTVLFYLFTPFYTPLLPGNRFQILYFFLAIVVALFLWRLAYITLISSPRFYKRILIIGNTANAEIMVNTIEKSDPNYKVVGFINTGKENNRSIDIPEFVASDLNQIIQENYISEIIIAGSISKKLSLPIYTQLLDLLEKGFSIKEYTQVYEDLTYRVPVHYIDKDFYRYFPFSRSNQNKLYQFFHRIMDLLLSLVGLIIGLVLLPFILLGNSIGNKGPLLYFQERVGKNGRLFRMIKFRTMIKNAEKDGAKWSEFNDVRVTKFGKFLRKTRFDEIPQFVNIIKGDMSIIGPRPERPVFVTELSKEIPFYELRHIIKPGLTGWAQVKSNYASSKEDALEKLQYDLYYIKKTKCIFGYEYFNKNFKHYFILSWSLIMNVL